MFIGGGLENDYPRNNNCRLLRNDRSIFRLSTSLWQSWITDRIRLWTGGFAPKRNFACAYSCHVQQIIDQPGFELQVTV
jgi:hypothetical protein